MLTQIQEEYLAIIPEDTIANIKPWDTKAVAYAKQIIGEIESFGLEVFWEGSLALEIPGENDIDLYIFSEPKYFEKYTPPLVSILGKPTYKLAEKILWRTKKDGYKIDAGLIDKNSPEVKMDLHFYQSLKSKPELLQEYASLKKPGLTAREYYRKKNEFYNIVTGNT